MSLTKGHVPQRTCIVCRQVRPKAELIRIVHTVAGEIKPDEGGREAGRGAYLCPSRECWEQLLKRDRKDRLSRALRTKISPDERARLSNYGQTLPRARVALKDR